MYKVINGFENYAVNELGNVKNIKTGIVLKGGLTSMGYRCVTLRKNNRNYTKNIHRLVAETFIDNPDNLPCVNHKDENKQNNAVYNLEWCSYSYNNTYGTFLIRRSITNSITVCKYDLSDKLIETYTSIKVASLVTGINHANISAVCKGKRQSAGGYKWRYV